MPKILRIINRFNIGGPTYNAAYLTKYLSPEFETLLIGGKKEESEESSEYILHGLGIKPVIIDGMKRNINPLKDIAAYREIKKIIRDFKPDIVHTHAAKAGAVGRRAAFYCKVPVVVHTFHGHVFHSYFGSSKTAIYKRIERNLAKRTNAIIAISEKQKEELANIYKICQAEKIHVIPLGFDLQRFHDNEDEKRKTFRSKYKLDEDVISIGIVGRLVPVKNHSLFIDAIKYVSGRSEKKIKAFIIGDGEQRARLEMKARECGLEQIIVFTSWEKQVENSYPGLDIICLTSFNEGTPVSLIEAQAAGKPIVSTNVGGIENVVIPNETALLSDVNDKEKFYQNLLRLVNDPGLRKSLSLNGWKNVKEKFHFTRLCHEMSSLYKSLLTC